MDKNASLEAGRAFGLGIVYVTVALFVLCLILYFTKQYTIVSILKNIFAWFCMILGGLMLLIFSANVYYGNFFPTIMIGALVFSVIGFLLWRWKLPVKGGS